MRETTEFILILHSHCLSFPINLVFRILHIIPAPLLQRNNQASFDLFNYISGKGQVPGAIAAFSLVFFLALSESSPRTCKKARTTFYRELEEATRKWHDWLAGPVLRLAGLIFQGEGSQLKLSWRIVTGVC